VTAREMFVGEAADFQEGWLVFESAGERRRLAPYPNDWSARSPERLEQLLARAVRVATRTPSAVEPRTTTGELRRFEDEGADAPHDAVSAPRAEPAPRALRGRRSEDRAH
jgi:hypothetical protein